MKPGFAYLLTNKNNTTLYVGSTSRLVQRIKQHKEKFFPKSFSAQYNLNKLVYFEAFQMIGDAVGREQQLKAGNRAKKVALINGANPEWLDLYEEVKQLFGSDAEE
ncbi:GIY-YIG nuclease family protein [Subsaximicrobium wynnwilliamsii]|uniref:GIY-YIG nuclease family protein n=1 Tax=Subsaximicrobium wynnwilliamsii TaxID=291179 RepID=A0A5C6ZCV1_9FLAO|nr:GIY-YIG nuclease family protein [Subsaximicrobium wynnwilliamsii]TXD81706.1 GIY-YIG nuclease family protein [Subsaximicrobium wynnwilliamsii]TXD87461.1 GIY-YIG nuclease family protein [Subsaximicrobium wynnwilliamsii]TXE01149.1 GIY-YIG nuclease family protein [Subsaximicrobium wynnwilliamsii]